MGTIPGVKRAVAKGELSNRRGARFLLKAFFFLEAKNM